MDPPPPLKNKLTKKTFSKLLFFSCAWTNFVYSKRKSVMLKDGEKHTVYIHLSHFTPFFYQWCRTSKCMLICWYLRILPVLHRLEVVDIGVKSYIEKHTICLKEYRIRPFLSIRHTHGDLCKHLGIDSSTRIYS